MLSTEDFERLSTYPGMFLPVVDLTNMLSFLAGADFSSGGTMLYGFSEWLVVHRDGAPNLTWMAMVGEAVTDDEPEVQASQAVRLVVEFFMYRKTAGLRAVFLEYENWLRAQPWYGPGNPLFLSVRGV